MPLVESTASMTAFPETSVCPCEPFAEAVRRTAASLWCKTFELHAGEPQLARSSSCRRAGSGSCLYLGRPPCYCARHVRHVPGTARAIEASNKSKRPANPYKPQTVTTFGSEAGHRCSELPCVVHLLGRRPSTCTSKRKACKCAVVCLTIISRLPAPLNALANNPRVNGALGEHSPVGSVGLVD